MDRALENASRLIRAGVLTHPSSGERINGGPTPTQWPVSVGGFLS